MASMPEPSWPTVSRRQFLAGTVAMGAVALTGLPQLHAEREGPSAPAKIAGRPDTARQAGAELEVFADDFDRELAGERLTRWEHLGGVSVLGVTAFGDSDSAAGHDRLGALRRRGMVVALDGDAHGRGLPGRLRTVEAMEFVKGVRYTLEFDVAGAARGGHGDALCNSVVASVPGVGARHRCALPTGARFRPERITFVPRETCTSRIEFASGGSAGRRGLLVDNVRLSAAA